jgi:23S rRNA pseudouridine2605 synthase
MKPFDDEMQQDFERNSGAEQRERRSFNPNFTADNHLKRAPRRRVGDTRVPVGEQNGGYNRGYNNDGGYNNRGYNNDGGYNNNRGGYYNNNRGGYGDNGYNGGYNRDNNGEGGYNNNRGGGYNNNRGGGYNNNRGGGYNNNGGGYNNNRGGGYNNNRGGGYNNNRGGGFNNNRGGGFNNNNRGGGRPQNKRKQGNIGHRQIEYKSVMVDPNEDIRLNKYLANAGVCSRREADELIQAGAVSVNGTPITELGTKIKRGDKVLIGDQLVAPDKLVYILLNKPKGCVTSTDDPNAKLTVMKLVERACKERIYPVGRLDKPTTGVLLLTNDGDLASKLTHPMYNKKKIYQVTLNKELTEEDMATISAGIDLEDGPIKPDEVSYVDEADHKKIGIEIHSGRNRIVRRIFDKLGYRVMRLDRVFFAGLTKKGLKRGEWRFLTEREVSMLRMGAFE